MKSLYSEEVHFEQITAGVDSQELVISSDDLNPSASYVISSSMRGSRVEVIIEDGSTNSSQAAYDYRLCRKVEVLYSLGANLIQIWCCLFIASTIWILCHHILFNFLSS